MLKYLWRSTTKAARHDETDPLRIRNLLDDPQLRAVMGSALDDPAPRLSTFPAPDRSTFVPAFVLDGAA